MIESILRQCIRGVLLEVLEGPHISNVLSHDLIDREQIGSLGEEEEEISSHLMEPVLSPEKCFGPVPPIATDPGVYADPYTNDYHVLPTSTVKRG
jgi:hypothetical protein